VVAIAAMQGFEVQGDWWLPAAPERKLPGTLRFNPDDGATLSLWGAFRGFFEEDAASVDNDGVRTVELSAATIEESGIYPMVLGASDSHGYTLVDCFRTRLTNALFSGHGSETLHANQVLKDAHFDSDEPIDATGVSFGLRHLVYWVGASGLQELLTFERGEPPQGDVPRLTIQGFAVPDQQGQFGTDKKLLLTHRLGLKGDHIADRTITQNFALRIDTPNRVPISDLIELASALQALV
jgi:hypothetical protein